jgi:hypothetical protein
MRRSERPMLLALRKTWPLPVESTAATAATATATTATAAATTAATATATLTTEATAATATAATATAATATAAAIPYSPSSGQAAAFPASTATCPASWSRSRYKAVQRPRLNVLKGYTRCSYNNPQGPPEDILKLLGLSHADQNIDTFQPVFQIRIGFNANPNANADPDPNPVGKFF